MPLLLRKAVLRRSLTASAVPHDGDSAGHHRSRQQLLADAFWSRSPPSWSALLLTWPPFHPPGDRLRTREPSGHILDYVAYAAICVLVSHLLSAHWSHSGSLILLMAAAPGAPSSSSSSACQWPMRRRRAERSCALFAGIRCWTECPVLQTVWWAAGWSSSCLEEPCHRALRWPPLLPLQGHLRPAVHTQRQGLHVPLQLPTPRHTVPATSADGPILPTLTHRPSPPSTLGTPDSLPPGALSKAGCPTQPLWK